MQVRQGFYGPRASRAVPPSSHPQPSSYLAPSVELSDPFVPVAERTTLRERPGPGRTRGRNSSSARAHHGRKALLAHRRRARRLGQRLPAARGAGRFLLARRCLPRAERDLVFRPGDGLESGRGFGRSVLGGAVWRHMDGPQPDRPRAGRDHLRRRAARRRLLHLSRQPHGNRAWPRPQRPGGAGAKLVGPRDPRPCRSRARPRADLRGGRNPDLLTAHQPWAGALSASRWTKRLSQ